MSSLVVEMDLLLSRSLRLSNSCPSSPVPARIRIPESRPGLFFPNFQERDLWTIQDRDSGILIRDSGGAMSAGISSVPYMPPASVLIKQSNTPWGQKRGDVEIVSYLQDAAGARNLVFDLRITMIITEKAPNPTKMVSLRIPTTSMRPCALLRRARLTTTANSTLTIRTFVS